MTRLAIDFEFASRIWWESGGQDLWDALAEDFDGSRVIVDDDLASSWLVQAEQMASLGVVAPPDLASMVVYLASPAAARLTGQAISINGGISAA